MTNMLIGSPEALAEITRIIDLTAADLASNYLSPEQRRQQFAYLTIAIQIRRSYPPAYTPEQEAHALVAAAQGQIS